MIHALHQRYWPAKRQAPKYPIHGWLNVPNLQFPHLHLIAAPIASELVVQNIQTILYPKKTTGEVDSKVKLNLEFLKTFIDATKYILHNFCQIKEVNHSKPHLYNPDEATAFAIEGQIHLKSSEFEGQFIIGFKKDIHFSPLSYYLFLIY